MGSLLWYQDRGTCQYPQHSGTHLRPHPFSDLSGDLQWSERAETTPGRWGVPWTETVKTDELRTVPKLKSLPTWPNPCRVGARECVGETGRAGCRERGTSESHPESVPTADVSVDPDLRESEPSHGTATSGTTSVSPGPVPRCSDPIPGPGTVSEPVTHPPYDSDPETLVLPVLVSGRGRQNQRRRDGYYNDESCLLVLRTARVPVKPRFFPSKKVNKGPVTQCPPVSGTVDAPVPAP